MSEEEAISLFESMQKIHCMLKKINNKNYLSNLTTMSIIFQSFKMNIINSSIEIRKSNIHGNGLFAKKDIIKGDIITFYPIDCIVDENNVNSQGLVGHRFNDKIFNIDTKYKVDINGSISIYGNPENTQGSAMLDHMINDSESITIDDKEKINKHNIKKLVGNYILKSKNNARMEYNKDRTLCYYIARTDIKKDDEILASYSPMFWLNEEQTKMLAELCITDINMIKFIEKFNDI